MPFRRDIVLDADPATTYAALREVVAPNLEEGPFEITVDDPEVEFGIAYLSMLSSARYRFNIEAVEQGTRLEARLWLGGLVGPLQSALRFWTHNRHLERLLAGIEREAAAIQKEDAADAEAAGTADDGGTVDASLWEATPEEATGGSSDAAAEQPPADADA